MNAERDLFEFAAVRHDYDARGRGTTTVAYLLDRDRGTWVRLDRVPGAQVLQTAADLQGSPAKFQAKDRRSETRVALGLNHGDLVATVRGTSIMEIREAGNRGTEFDEMIAVPFHEAGDIRLENAKGEVLPAISP